MDYFQAHVIPFNTWGSRQSKRITAGTGRFVKGGAESAECKSGAQAESAECKSGRRRGQQSARVSGVSARSERKLKSVKQCGEAGESAECESEAQAESAELPDGIFGDLIRARVVASWSCEYNYFVATPEKAMFGGSMSR
ncbi:hypothetical protein CYMTET_34850 [Cymbomonas tetramitiformis]|uniref:Uncharacterized protein n=1 Tax=Cymbomonas tetramitiformis TaxID=36881 RepID=A0AAE0KPJ8_9CHLO|nr:hypothetical protein CYMTET_34850 [Cymbomonas tetramitiformis]